VVVSATFIAFHRGPHTLGEDVCSPNPEN